MKLLFILFLGIGILLGALVLNLIASQLGLMSWFTFLKTPDKAGVASYIWLFFLYPFGLGVIAYLVKELLGM